MAAPCKMPIKKTERAATLIEAMVAVVVFSIAAMGLFAHITYSRNALSIENRRRSVAEIAQSRLELLRTVPYTSLPGYAEEGTAVDVESVEGNTLAGTRTTTVDDVDADEDGTSDYRVLTVTVWWTGSGEANGVTLSTIRSSYR